MKEESLDNATNVFEHINPYWKSRAVLLTFHPNLSQNEGKLIDGSNEETPGMDEGP